MGSIPVAKPSPPRRLRPSRVAVALALLAAALAAGLALIVLFAWPNGDGGPRPFDAGPADDFAPGSVTTFREAEFHLVRLPGGQFLALDMRDPHGKMLVEQGLAPSPCLVPWRADFTFMGQTGWFRNPCHGETYDMAGQCVSGPCIRGLDRHPVVAEDGKIEVDLGELISGRPTSTQVTPVSAP